MKKIVLFLSLILISLGLAGCSNVQKEANTTDTWSKIVKNKTVVVGLDDSFVPMGFSQKNGQLAGYDVDLAREVFKQYGIKVNFQTIDWSMNATELRNGTIDLIWNGYSITPEREEKVMFSRPYLKNRQVLVVKRDSNVHNFKQMKSKELGMQTGSTAEQWYEGKQNVLRAKKAVLYDQVPNSFLDLNANRIQGILLDEVYANYYIAHQANKDAYRVIINDKVPADYFAVGMRKGDKTLRKKINYALGQLQKNGKLEKLNKKWFGRQSNYLGRD
ncbi:amino acid ABC transporter substrate-binding protein [Lactobacillus sp. PSON]|uniref:amino acid ABC transporter substrate-binding protein n=1 Tax=Lactobacillus sp. PSON TaxID=3455454 RepID=UPI00404302EE